ncbi:MAG: transglycosylase SLT domain-containing protein [Paludibacteraceae bacterium]|jgi:membrane-bound lytic murein transglycosylase D|nr:transglycosylase SLT domain-containing protein [Paludibacteraceae bacterium]MDI9536414.1 transglycosylase SLT domain-containing protein [Bacteroidota bacterium]OQC34416.1 MAG: Membrane-bound lytic murein transglycosylase D precursor [Bacteroidetes bacterium ADurb.Bin057]HHT61491.1 transglycosylase SLT domain-containing protein [Bacteroidales bacterium]MBP9038816.1 transglycosylase SLT domain-containing protein [Paludibacteraceae bacterium]
MKVYSYFVAAFFACTSISLTAQTPLSSVVSIGTVQHTDEEINSDLDSAFFVPSDFSESLDAMLHDWYMEQTLVSDCSKDTTTITYPDSVYIERLQQLPCVIPMPYNSIVSKMINFYIRHPRMVENMLGLGEVYYFPMFETTLMKYQLPLELKYLPVIESALNARAISRAGAGGLWQFMVSTGKIYNLEVNSLVDERCDPLKATDAAARYLKDLYNIYNDWHLVIAAYNCGPGNVARAIRNSGGKKSYWEIYPFLPAETRSYVPIFIAANYIMNYYQAHNMCPAQPTITTATDTLMVNDRVHLQQISDVLEISIEELRFLNPQYRQDLIPGNIKKYPLVLPINQIGAYLGNRDTILAYNKNLVEQPGVIEPPKEAVYQGGYIYHKVTPGQTLGGIAQKYRVTVAQIKRWNGLRGSMIRAGKKLKIYKKG